MELIVKNRKLAFWLVLAVMLGLIIASLTVGLDTVLPTAAEIDQWSWKKVAVVCAGMVSFAIFAK